VSSAEGGRRSGPVVALALIAAVGLFGCGPAEGRTGGSSSSGGRLTVLAAASLTQVFTAIGRDFERGHPGSTVRFSFGPSDGLAEQIIEGAPGDVYASASPVEMDRVQTQGPGVDHRGDFARNSLTVITPADDPAGIVSLRDLTRPGVELVLAAEGVPAGDYAREVLRNAGILAAATANVVSNESDVKGVVQKVLLGEADAGIVYRTDVTPDVASRVRQIDIPPSLNVMADYPIAVVDGSPHPDLAAAFVRYVLGPGQEVLRRYGFGPPG
jgi:molybdate transport system substrate-binding protein